MKRLIVLVSLFLFSFSACAVGNEKSSQSTGDKMTANPKVLIETTLGNITLELDAENAPNSTENFVAYVNDGFYDGTIFHRVIPGFMVQGGGMNPDMSEKTTKATIKNEANNGLKNDRGTVAMARTNEPHSASSQFFINVKDNDFLNFKSEDMRGWGYAVFGKVVDGMDVMDKIVAVETGNNGYHQDVPKESILMNKVTITNAE
ncbi:MAG: Peptidyl-prolyl cis-trans isomerase PpiB (EC [uncultured Thiotrichaceae bacterium]|uniref:Peptidyl-prolyl cis-trans isomerase n=1 Tax=uncultured Thiotrichaceae bacterium TaxID=298394 RepID=A0A6S6UG63_9GAMM|nr:MAG: Peptidyl-prolyl cis-trans isomerase PpiB (EC [uncultured Thiotrichaceae bacterium]